MRTIAIIFALGALFTLTAFAGSPSEQLQMAKEELKELRLRYLDTHPFVVRQKAKIANLEKMAAEAKPQPSSPDAKKTPPGWESPLTYPTNPPRIVERGTRTI